MRKVGLTSLLVSTLLLAGCTFDFAHKTSSNGIDNPFAEEISISQIKIYSEEGMMHIYYDNQINPFKYSGHTFSHVLINDEQPVKISYSEFLNSKGYFDALPKTINQTSYKVAWIDKNNSLYMFGECSNVKQYEEEIITPDDPDDNPGIKYPEGYTALVWADEFEGDKVDDDKWNYDIGNGSNGWGNGEGEYYTRENATVSDGKLHISCKKENKGNFHYTSSRMVTRGKYAFKYGYIEAKISLPEVVGMWPAFWMLPEDNVYGGWPYSGEIDIMEAKGRFPRLSSSALHHTNEKGGHTYETHENSFANGGTMSSFHTYACEWKKEEISFYVDDVKHLTVNYETWMTSKALDNAYAPFEQDFHLILNLAIGGHFDGYRYPDDGFVSADMVVDYVRVFK